jgi:hypothetical protein
MSKPEKFEGILFINHTSFTVLPSGLCASKLVVVFCPRQSREQANKALKAIKIVFIKDE